MIRYKIGSAGLMCHRLSKFFNSMECGSRSTVQIKKKAAINRNGEIGKGKGKKVGRRGRSGGEKLGLFNIHFTLGIIDLSFCAVV